MRIPIDLASPRRSVERRVFAALAVTLIIAACSGGPAAPTPTLQAPTRAPGSASPVPSIASVAISEAPTTAPPSASLPPAAATGGRGQIVFTSDRDGQREIYAMNADGTGLRRLTDNPAKEGWPAVAPNGELIAFYSDRDGKFETYIMNSDGRDVRRLTTAQGNDGFAAWSPDDKKMPSLAPATATTRSMG
jgi:dipeptidyl aminopeptidase/acylaminoacyl peptidase